MMRLLLLIPLILLLSGCPGGGKPIPQFRSVYMNDGVICFSVDKQDIVSFYRIDSTSGTEYRVIDAKEGVHLSYPNTCIKPKLEKGYKYNITYNLNGKYYTDYFFLDNKGNN
ncbi:TPA: putative T6SS immunity periplasmic lipoprotein [Citrobacter freundii]